MRVLKREEIELPTELTQDEFNAKARELAATHEQLGLEREGQKQAKTEMKARIEELEQKRTELARVVRDRKELRLVPVEHHANDARSTVEFVRMDTGEVYAHRPMAPGDRQLTLLESSAEKPGKGSSRPTGDSTKH